MGADSTPKFSALLPSKSVLVIRLLIFIPAYNASTTIEWVLGRIPADLAQRYDLHVLIIDDASVDDTAVRAKGWMEKERPPFEYTILVNPENRGYGGNQKLGYTFAIKRGFDVVVMLHGDGQYPPEAIEELVAPLSRPGVSASLGSRFIRGHGARDGGMPVYKLAGNRILTYLENRMLGTSLSEFHSGFRAYSVSALACLPFHLNTDDFHFDTEIIIQFSRTGSEIVEIDIPTYYGEEVCYVNGVSYALNVLKQCLRALVHDKGIFHEPKYDVLLAGGPVARYESKTDFTSPTTLAVDKVGSGESVLDVGSGAGGLADLLHQTRSCQVFGIDIAEPPNIDRFARFWTHDFDGKQSLPQDLPPVNTVILLDVVEHLRDPEGFVRDLAEYCQKVGTVQRLLVSTGNIGFAVIRAGLIFGQFNYGSRGILDRTHTRLFTYRSFRRLFEQAGFKVIDAVGVPAPFPLAIRNRRLANLALRINEALIRVRRSLFAYQIFMEVKSPIGQSQLLEASTAASADLWTDG